MSTLKALLLLFAVMFVGGPGLAAEGAEAKTAIREDRAARMILVTFVDRTINRVASAGSGSHYQRRGYYQQSTWSTRIATQISETYHLRQVNEWPIDELGVYCVVYEVAGNEPLESVLEALRRDQSIDTAQPMHTFHTMATHYSDPYFRLQNSLQTMQIEAAHRRATGRGIQIAVIDTGMDLEHPDLQGQVSDYRDLTGAEGGRYGAELHGTAVAGVIAARADNGEGIVGVAPDAEILGLKACWQTKPATLQAECNSLTLAIALNTAIRMKPHILNMSLTGPSDPLLQQLIERALAKGIIIVAAADQTGGKGGFPALMPGVIAAYSPEPTLGSSAVQGRYRVTAPGVEILTTFPQRTYNFVSGSSISAANISGIAALLLELQPGLSAADIAGILAASSIDAAQKASGVNADAAIAQLHDVKYASSEKHRNFLQKLKAVAMGF